MSKSKSLISLFAAAGIVLSSAAFAQEDSNAKPSSDNDQVLSTQQVDRSKWINMKEAVKALEDAGYDTKDIDGIHTTRQGYVARARNDDGYRVRILIDPTSAEISPYEHKNLNTSKPQRQHMQQKQRYYQKGYHHDRHGERGRSRNHDPRHHHHSR